MSKFWLLLLLVAAFQFARSYPAVEYEVDEYINDETDDYLSDEDTLGNVIQLTMSKLKDNYKTNDKNGTNKIVAIIRDKYCGLQEDFEDDYQSDETQDKVYYVYRLLQTFRKFYDKANDNWAQKEDKLNVALAILRKKFCVSLSSPLLESDYYEDADYMGGNGYFEDEGDDGGYYGHFHMSKPMFRTFCNGPLQGHYTLNANDPEEGNCNMDETSDSSKPLRSGLNLKAQMFFRRNYIRII